MPGKQYRVAVQELSDIEIFHLELVDDALRKSLGYLQHLRECEEKEIIEKNIKEALLWIKTTGLVWVG